MSSWDNPRFDNQFTFEGSFDHQYQTGSGRNPVFGYTFSPGNGWLSVSSPNLIQLASDTKVNGDQKKEIMVLMKGQGGLAREFEVFRSNPNYSRTLRIYIFAAPGKASEDKKVVIHGVKVRNSGPPRMSVSIPMTKRKYDLPLASEKFALVYTLTYDSLEVI